MNLKGTLPTLILAVLEAGPSHGYAISKDLQQRSNGQLDFGAGSRLRPSEPKPIRLPQEPWKSIS